MSVGSDKPPCGWTDLLPLQALGALPPDEAAGMLAHVSSCGECRRELAAFAPVLDSFGLWPTDVLRPSESLRTRLAQRIARETGGTPVLPPACARAQTEWEEVAPGISCKLLSSDTPRGRVSMLVRLAPGCSYPPHIHAGVEELYLLHGELWIEARKLYPGDYNRSAPGTADQHVWSQTGCTCVLITSTQDMLR